MNRQYDMAKHIYKLLLHFKHCSDDILTDRLSKKLTLIEKIENGDEVEANLKNFSELSENLGLTADLTAIESSSPVVASNLLALPVR